MVRRYVQVNIVAVWLVGWFVGWLDGWLHDADCACAGNWRQYGLDFYSLDWIKILFSLFFSWFGRLTVQN